MSKFNKGGIVKPTIEPAEATSPIKSVDIPGVQTHLGGKGYTRDAKSELFLLGTANFVSEDSFHEDGNSMDARFDVLCGQVAVTDGPWFRDFIFWLRSAANMRHASIVGAVQGVKARLEAGVGQGVEQKAFTRKPGDLAVKSDSASRELLIHGDGVSNRQVISSVLQRADELGEMYAYARSIYEKTVPQPIKRGIADAAGVRYNEYSLLKYDSEKSNFRFGDVIDLTHPSPKNAWQSALYKHAIDRRHGNALEVPEELTVLKARESLMAMPVEERREMIRSGQAIIPLHNAGMTWESVAGWIQGPMDKQVWEAIIPSMGYMALLRNLRNFLDADVSEGVMDGVLARLTDPEEVASSRQFPFRFLSAYKEVKGSLKVSAALEKALNYSVRNVPALSGNSLILSDTSGSMYCEASGKMSKLQRVEAAAIFAAALALRAEKADLIAFGTSSVKIAFSKGDSILTLANKIAATDLGGTNTAQAVAEHLNGHDRVVIVTDEQANGGYWGEDPAKHVPANVPMYTWNLGGYKVAHAPSGVSNRHTFGGLTDQAFQMIPILEAGANGVWPWEQQD